MFIDIKFPKNRLTKCVLPSHNYHNFYKLIESNCLCVCQTNVCANLLKKFFSKYSHGKQAKTPIIRHFTKCHLHCFRIVGFCLKTVATGFTRLVQFWAATLVIIGVQHFKTLRNVSSYWFVSFGIGIISRANFMRDTTTTTCTFEMCCIWAQEMQSLISLSILNRKVKYGLIRFINSNRKWTAIDIDQDTSQ